jgi:hypothetical protein
MVQFLPQSLHLQGARRARQQINTRARSIPGEPIEPGIMLLTYIEETLAFKHSSQACANGGGTGRRVTRQLAASLHSSN